MSSAVTNLRRQFVERRLWPVAIVLVAALAAVPMVLGKDPAPPAPAPPAPAADADAPGELAAQPIVAPTETATRVKRRKVLGTAKNPFGVADTDTASATPPDSPTATAQEPSQDTGATGGSTTPTGGSTPPGTVTPTPAPTTPAEPAPAPKQYAPEEITVRFAAGDDKQRESVKRLQALPSEQEPVLIYMGVQKDGKTAVFLLGDGVEAVGDGECKPSPEQCEKIRLRAGETEFLDVKDESGVVTDQYQLDLIKIHRAGAASDEPTRTRSALAAGTRQAAGTELRATAGRVSTRLP